MSTTDPKPRKQKQKESKSQSISHGTERLKTVVRRLPPNLPEEIFWQSVQQWVTDETVTWKTYHPGKIRTKRVNKEGIPSRAYIAFRTEAQVTTFSRAYDGHVFRDKAGNESFAVVEYAPFQKVPTEKKRVDARNNTIDKDEDYLSFLETLKGTGKTESVTLEALIAASQPPPPPTTTPLLEALKAEKSAQKDKEAILRNHAHYKDTIASGSSSKKEEAKKKAVAAAQQTAKPESSALTSKKAKKAAAAAQKVQVQEGQVTPGKGVSGAASVKAAQPVAGHGRHRTLKELHGRSQLGKSDTSAAPTGSGSTSGPGPSSGPPPSVTTDTTAQTSPVATQGQGQRKNRPVIGLGRHFEAALSGAGVAVSPSPGDRKRRDKDKGGDSGVVGVSTGPSVENTTSGPGRGGKQKYQRSHPLSPSAEVVPSILQRPQEGSTGPEVLIMQRPQSMEGVSTGAGGTPSASIVNPGPSVRGGPRRGRGRGRGGQRGGQG